MGAKKRGRKLRMKNKYAKIGGITVMHEDYTVWHIGMNALMPFESLAEPVCTPKLFRYIKKQFGMRRRKRG